MQEYIALHSNHRFINMFYQENTEKARSYEEFLLACNMSKHLNVLRVFLRLTIFYTTTNDLYPARTLKKKKSHSRLPISKMMPCN